MLARSKTVKRIEAEIRQRGARQRSDWKQRAASEEHDSKVNGKNSSRRLVGACGCCVIGQNGEDLIYRLFLIASK